MEKRSQELFTENNFKIKHQPILIIDHPRSPQNIGSVMRLGANVDALKILIIDEEPQHKLSHIKKTASSAFDKIPWEFIKAEDLYNHLPEGYELYAIETTDCSVNIYEADLPEKIALVVGNEVYGIADEVLSNSVEHIYIPMFGITKSMNVTHALSVATFEWIRRHHF